MALLKTRRLRFFHSPQQARATMVSNPFRASFGIRFLHAHHQSGRLALRSEVAADSCWILRAQLRLGAT
jgi:hypothetical protein